MLFWQITYIVDASQVDEPKQFWDSGVFEWVLSKFSVVPEHDDYQEFQGHSKYADSENNLLSCYYGVAA